MSENKQMVSLCGNVIRLRKVTVPVSEFSEAKITDVARKIMDKKVSSHSILCPITNTPGYIFYLKIKGNINPHNGSTNFAKLDNGKVVAYSFIANDLGYSAYAFSDAQYLGKGTWIGLFHIGFEIEPYCVEKKIQEIKRMNRNLLSYFTDLPYHIFSEYISRFKK